MSLCQFRLIHSIFQSIEILKKNLTSLCLFRSIETVFRSIETRESGFLKTQFDLFKSLFQNFFKLFSLSPTRQGSIEIFRRFPSFFLQGFSLPKSICPFYSLFFIYFLFYMHFLCIEGLFSDLAYFGVFDDTIRIL